MSHKIFISYRRDDGAAHARIIRDRLAAKFGEGRIFLDVDNLLAGQRFDQELEQVLADCDVVIAVIGPRWVELIGAHNTNERPDYVRQELASALLRGIPVIPVLVDGAPLPKAEMLPAEIQSLVMHQMHTVSHEHLARDIEGLTAAIRVIAARTAGSDLVHRWRRPLVVATAAVALIVAFAGAYWTVRAPSASSLRTSAELPRESVWDHNSSTMRLEVKGARLYMFYKQPRPGMLSVGAQPNDLLFQGESVNGQIKGVAKIYKSGCGTFPYEVLGRIENSGRRIVLDGRRPHISDSCQMTDFGNDHLIFDRQD